MELDSLNSAQKLPNDATPLATHGNTSTNVDQVVLTLRLVIVCGPAKVCRQ